MRRRIPLIVLTVVVLAAIALTAVGYSLPRRSFPQINGEIHLSGLDGPVDIYRDPLGIPHIYASTEHDLFFAQGYLHAQDRFWQMDFWRHIGAGRLSEMFGKSQLETDIFLRRMGWARVSQQELDHLDADSKSILVNYAAGVNAYLANHQGDALSLEYAVLKLTNSHYTVEPWTPLNSLTWAKAMAWDLRGNMDEEADRTILLKTYTRQQVDELYPPYPNDHPVIVSQPAALLGPALAPQAAETRAAETRGAETRGAETSATLASPDTSLGLSAIHKDALALDALIGPAGAGIGSNNWVISGKLTTTGKPLLANDPHLGPQIPSIWYEIGLHCAPKSEKCPFEVTGFSFAGAPGVVIGHNDRIAWGFTNVGPDVQDVYIEKINPYNPNQYEVNGKWVDMTKVKEIVQVAGDKPVEITVRYTRHGPILWEDQKALDKYRLTAGVELPVEYRLALRWTALEESHTFPAMWRIDQAQNWDEFRQAASMFDVPAQNFVYADVDGNIGYQMPGKVPIRASGDGRYNVPGWTDQYEWTGYIPFDDLPRAFNPPEGFIATANNAVVAPTYKYLISTDWDAGFRAERITELIKSAPGPIDIAYIQKMQGDDLNLSAKAILSTLVAVKLNNAPLEQTREVLASWDDNQGMDSAQAALYEVFWKNLLANTFANKLPEDYKIDGGSRWYEVMRRLVSQPDSKWWDNPKTDAVETRDDIFRKSIADAVAELERLQGRNASKWNWGNLHTITFRNQTLGKSGIGPIEALFNRGPFRTAGGEGIINATGWDAAKGYEVNWVPSMRMIVDLADLNRSLTINTTGASGHAYNPHYIDLANMWRNIQYHPMRWDATDIRATAEGHLVLAP
ncbi:MAG TPA: penicillin acylase family protein [Anaerolineaceae bacterium]